MSTRLLSGRPLAQKHNPVLDPAFVGQVRILRRESVSSVPAAFRRQCRSWCFKVTAAATIEKPPIDSAVPLTSTLDRAVNVDETVLLQGFGWDSCRVGGWYNIVKSKIPDIKAAGFTHIWLPPPSQSVAPQGYLPGKLYTLDSAYGSKDELVALLKELKAEGISPVADIVINHRCAQEQDESGVWNSFSEDIDYKGNSIDWDKWAITSNDPHFGGVGNPDTGADFDAAPDLDHLNEELRAGLVDWMTWLKEEIGFEGWRFDFVKGYAPHFIEEYAGKTVGNDVFNVGELWTDMDWEGESLRYNQDGPRQALCDWLDKAGGCTAFDFATKGIANAAFGSGEFWRLRDEAGKQAGLMGWWPAKAVTFIDNHDTGSTQQHWPFPESHEETGYAYILSHPGMPCILWEHIFDNEHWGQVIRALVDIRKRNKIVATSALDIKVAEQDLYIAEVGGRLLVKLGGRMDMGSHEVQEGDGWKFALSGKNFAIWERDAAKVPEETQTHVDDGKDDTAKSAAEAFAEQFKIEDVEPNNAST